MKDAFDAALTKLADVLERGHGAADDYGVSAVTFTTVSPAQVPCRVSLGKGRAKESKAGTKTARNYRCVFMRPVSNLSGTYATLNHDHWLRIDGQLYDIFQIDNPGDMDHHLEVWCELILP